MLYSLRRRWSKHRFERLTKGIMSTPPLRVVPAGWTIVSMVSNADVQMYLLSIKSFYARLGRGKIVAIVDRDMPPKLRQVLQQHVPGIEFAILEDIDTGRCQRGGTWERLVYLLRHAETEYAIQLDSDTLSFGADLDEVRQCAEGNRAFTLNSGYETDRLLAPPGFGGRVAPMREFAEEAKALAGDYVGNRAERLFDRYPDCDRRRYIRGSSGLAGFAVGGCSFAEVEEFHEIMRRQMGDADWRKWGTEQCASNFAIANSPDPLVLPYPKYANFDPDAGSRDHAFFHFIGTYRFARDCFADCGRKIIEELAAS